GVVEPVARRRRDGLIGISIVPRQVVEPDLERVGAGDVGHGCLRHVEIGPFLAAEEECGALGYPATVIEDPGRLLEYGNQGGPDVPFGPVDRPGRWKIGRASCRE